MESDLWADCLVCKDKCCEWKNSLPFPLFVTKEERKSIKDNNFNPSLFDTPHPCSFLNSGKTCSIYSIRPTDCRLFPFDVHQVDGVFCWIMWTGNCSITHKPDKEKYLEFFEKNLIPYFKQHLEDYSDFLCEELLNNYEFEMLREIRM